MRWIAIWAAASLNFWVIYLRHHVLLIGFKLCARLLLIVCPHVSLIHIIKRRDIVVEVFISSISHR